MTIAPGTRVGPYEIVGAIGAGGMGEVFRGRDPKLGRDVAIKVLPDQFANDAERVARFDREARTLAALNHPNIAQIYGLEQAGNRRALVMELVDGVTLAERIALGPMSLSDALPIAKQIASALEAAHDHGIVHRDLKPANVKIKDDGTVKVLDFGLAKAIDPAVDASSAEMMNSPTLTVQGTQLGVILGTAAYMSPEQARGKVVDKRADIWAFGLVLYEMLAGRRAFDGDTVSDTLAAVLKTEPDWSRVPIEARPLLRNCVEKDPKLRLRDIGDAWRLLDLAPAGVAVPARSRSGIAWGVAGVLALAAATLGLVHFRETTPVPPPVRFEVSPPPKTSFDIYLALSPDGRRLAFTARDARGDLNLWVRDLDSVEPRLLPGTENAWSPFWSPDSRSLAFAVDNQLKRVDLSGGAAQTLCVVSGVVGTGSWNRDGVIVFGMRGGGPLRRVSASGGTVSDVTETVATRQELFHAFPVFLPDARHFLYYRRSGDPALEGIYVGSLDVRPDAQSTERLLHATFGIAYSHAPGTSTGKLVFLRDGVLMTQQFDADRLQLAGDPVRLAERVGSSGAYGYFSVVGDVLAYRHGTIGAPISSQLGWVDRTGKALGDIAEPSNYGSVMLSHDGNHAAVAASLLTIVGASDIWLVDLRRSLRTRFTFDTASDLAPIWSPDGGRIVFRSTRSGLADLYQKASDGSAAEQLLLKSDQIKTPTSWSPDGRYILFTQSAGAPGNDDIWVLPVDGESKPVPWIQSEFSERQARFSPDARWIAYVSNESGRDEVYVRPFLPPGSGSSSGGKWQVTRDGGSRPIWRRDGKEVFYRSPTGAVMSVDVLAGSAFQSGEPRTLFVLPQNLVEWDVSPDGQRFLMARPIQPLNAAPITVELNWLSRLTK